uniref:Uncharacterized protein n=2 Tax=environmental samples TaxID=651140 RepID=A0A075G4R5_9ARCH|nr:hypothetical protein [uncultured marine thaumarchaeote KM3_06_A04]AIE98598.1 hypothetical protein [uncultured marine thaumarchaeote KM3_06_B06]
MDDEPLTVSLRYYGISPWEIEVVYNLFNGKFSIIQEETEQNNESFVSALTIDIPLQFSEEFFKWFEFKAWEKVKSIIKEMKRRRGKGNAIIVEILFVGEPNIRFVIDINENHNFNSAVEKIDFVVELLPYHLNDSNIPNELSEVVYKYDIGSGRWRFNLVLAGQKKFIPTEKGWKVVT